MFKARQIVSASEMKRNFYRYCSWIRHDPQAFLIHSKNKRPLVLVDAEIFEDLMEFKFEGSRCPSESQSLEQGS